MKQVLSVVLAVLLTISALACFSFAEENNVYTPDSSWKIEASSEKSSNTIAKAFDGNTGSYWHTNYTVKENGENERDTCPHTVTVTFPNPLTIEGVRYIPRQKTEKDSSASGSWKAADFYVSTDGKNFTKVKSETFDIVESRATQDVSITKGSYKAVRIVITDSVNQYATAAEIQFIAKEAALVSSEKDSKTENEVKTQDVKAAEHSAVLGAGELTGNVPDDSYTYGAGWSVNVSSAFNANSAKKMFDGDENTFWHSWYGVEDGKITTKDQAPYEIVITFSEKLSVGGIRYVPRQINGNDKSVSGIVLHANLYLAENGTDFVKAASQDFKYEAGYNMRETQEIKIVPKEAKAIKIVFSETVSGYGTCAELNILKGDAVTKTEDKEPAKTEEKKALKTIIMTVDSLSASILGENVTLAAPPTIRDGRTLVPVRFVSESLGATVLWDGETRMIDILDGTNKITLQVDSKKVTVNGVEKELDVPATIIGGSTMVPIRFVSENLGASVSWNQEKREITVTAPLTIACWGDSLTAGDGAVKSPYPTVLAQLTGADVYNLGIGGETALTIAARQGAYDIAFTDDFTIPESGSVELPLANIDGGTYLSTPAGGQVFPRQTTAKWNPCYINGVEGSLKIDVDTSGFPRVLKSVKFTRNEAGEAVNVKKGDLLKTSASYVDADINIIYIGCNGVWSEDNSGPKNNKEQADKLINMIYKMLEHVDNNDKYVVVGFTWGTKDEWSAVDEEMASAFGEHYINVKPYLSSEEALKAKGLTVTEKDKEDIEAGRVPCSLRKSETDLIHLNDYGYTALAEKIYEKLQSLGYVEQ